MFIKSIPIIIKNDLAYALQTARGILFICLFSLFWLIIFVYLEKGYAAQLANESSNAILSYVFDPQLIDTLFLKRSPTLSVFFIIALWVTPAFVMTAAADQTASDIQIRYLRFMTPRCNLSSIYIGRFLGAVCFTYVAWSIVTCIAAIIAISTDNIAVAEIIGYALRILIILLLYSLPFVAIMALCSAASGSVSIAFLIGFSAYTLTTYLFIHLATRWPSIEFIVYLLPYGFKNTLLISDSSIAIINALCLSVHASVLAYIGYLTLKARDL